MDAAKTLRIARPSDDLEALLPFYRDGLGWGFSIASRTMTASTA
jgi:hypothetical protein